MLPSGMVTLMPSPPQVQSSCAWQVLGGQVEELIETWTFQRKVGNVQRSSATTEDPEQAPAFQSFIPGRRHNQAGHRCWPCLTIDTPTCTCTQGMHMYTDHAQLQLGTQTLHFARNVNKACSYQQALLPPNAPPCCNRQT